MRFKKKSLFEFCVSLFIVLLMYLPGEANFILGICVLFLFCWKRQSIRKWENVIPILTLVFIGTLNGIFFSEGNSYRNIIRDSFYFIRGITFICLGQELYYQNRRINFLKVILQAVFIITILVYFSALMNFGTILSQISYLSIRKFFSVDNEGLAISLLILLTDRKELELIFSKKILNIMISLELLAFLLAFSRTGIVFLLLLLLITKIDIHKARYNIKSIKKFVGVVFILFVAFQILPSTIREPFIEKVFSSFKEIGFSKVWTDTQIVQNWRGYEIFSAQNLYKQGSIYTQLFGYGFGKLIPVKFSELVGIVPELGGITILHNGYYTILIKCGIAGVLLYFCFVLNNINYAVKAGMNYYSRILIGLTVAVAFDTYVVTGMFKENSSIIMLLTMGFYIQTVKYYIGKRREIYERTEENRVRENCKK